MSYAINFSLSCHCDPPAGGEAISKRRDCFVATLLAMTKTRKSCYLLDFFSILNTNSRVLLTASGLTERLVIPA